MNQPKVEKVVIIGAGSGGLSTALTLAEAGTPALVVEQRSEKAFGNTWCNDVEVATFTGYGLPKPLEDHLAFHFEHPYYIRSRDGRVQFGIDDLQLYPLMMSRYQEYLKKLCLERGVSFLFDTEAVDLRIEDDFITGLTVRNVNSDALLDIETEMVVAACGDRAKIFQQLPATSIIDLEIDPADYVFALQELWTIDKKKARQALPANNLIDKAVICHLGVSGSYSILLYQLDLDKGRFGILCGARIQDSGVTHPRKIMDEKIAGLGFCVEKTYAGGRHIPLRYPPFSMVHNGFAVVGDSAFMANPQNGSGTFTSMAAGKILAETMAAIIRKNGTFDLKSLWEYNHRFHTDIGAQLAGCYVSQKISRSLTEADVHNLLKHKIFRPQDIISAYETRAADITPLDGLYRLFHGLPALPLLIKFTKNGLRVQKAVKHYKKFPETCDLSAFRQWAEAAGRIFDF